MDSSLNIIRFITRSIKRLNGVCNLNAKLAFPGIDICKCPFNCWFQFRLIYFTKGIFYLVFHALLANSSNGQTIAGNGCKVKLVNTPIENNILCLESFYKNKLFSKVDSMLLFSKWPEKDEITEIKFWKGYYLLKVGLIDSSAKTFEQYIKSDKVFKSFEIQAKYYLNLIRLSQVVKNKFASQFATNLKNDKISSQICSGGGDSPVYVSTQKDKSFLRIDSFKNGLVSTLNLPFTINNGKLICVAKDGKTLFFNLNYNKGDIYYAKWENDRWIGPLPFPLINTPVRESGLCISPDLKRVVFSTERNTGAKPNLDLYVIEYQENGLWTIPKLLSKALTTSEDEDYPTFGPDGKTLFFSSKGFLGWGSFDLYYSNYDDQKGDWNVPTNLGAIFNSSFNDVSPILNNQGNLQMFCSDRYRNEGLLSIYELNDLVKAPLTIKILDPNALVEIGGLEVRIKPAGVAGLEGFMQLKSKNGRYTDSITANRLFRLEIYEKDSLLMTDTFTTIHGNNEKIYKIALSGLKNPMIYFEGGKVPAMARYSISYESNNLLLPNDKRQLERVKELLIKIPLYSIEIEYPKSANSSLDELMLKRALSLKEYITKNNTNTKTLLKQTNMDNKNHIQLKIEINNR